MTGCDGPIEPGLMQGGTFLLRRDRWYDPVLRLVLCRVLRKHLWVWCSAYVRHVPIGRPGDGRQVWWLCRLCGEQTEK